MAAGDKYDKDGKLIPQIAPATGTTGAKGITPSTSFTTGTGATIPTFFTPAAENTQLGQDQRQLAGMVQEYARSGTITEEGARLMQRARDLNIPENTIRGIYQGVRPPEAKPKSVFQQEEEAARQRSKDSGAFGGPNKNALNSPNTTTTRLLDRYDAMQGSRMGSVSNGAAQVSGPTGSRGTPISGSSQKDRYAGIRSSIMGEAYKQKGLEQELQRARIEAFKRANSKKDIDAANNMTADIQNGRYPLAYG
jgi:hypothetical protein